jgi:hypothetical protein
VEDLSEQEVRQLHERYQRLAEQARASDNPCARHTIEEVDPEGRKEATPTDRELQRA